MSIPKVVFFGTGWAITILFVGGFLIYLFEEVYTYFKNKRINKHGKYSLPDYNNYNIDIYK